MTLRETILASGARARRLLRKPRVLASLGSSFVRARLGRLPALFMADVNVTKKCNFACEHCFATAFDAGEPEPDTDAVVRTIRACKEAGVVFFNLQGGEPLVRKDLEEIVRACGRDETSVMINTNGYLLDRERIDRLARWGVYGVLVSVDSLSAEEHDRMRRKEGALDRILGNLDYLRERGMVANFLTVVSRGTVHTRGFRDLVDFAAKRRIPVGLLVAQRVGEWAHRPDVMCTPDDLRALDEIHRKHPFIRRDLHDTLSTRGCPAFKYSVYVTPGGEVCPCPFVHVSYGNLHREPLVDICKRGLSHHWFSDFAPRCPAAEEPRFIDEVQSKTWGAKRLPVPVGDIVPIERLTSSR